MEETVETQTEEVAQEKIKNESLIQEMESYQTIMNQVMSGLNLFKQKQEQPGNVSLISANTSKTNDHSKNQDFEETFGLL